MMLGGMNESTPPRPPTFPIGESVKLRRKRKEKKMTRLSHVGLRMGWIRRQKGSRISCFNLWKLGCFAEMGGWWWVGVLLFLIFFLYSDNKQVGYMNILGDGWWVVIWYSSSFSVLCVVFFYGLHISVLPYYCRPIPIRAELPIQEFRFFSLKFW